jgi:hypothetical protein
MSNLADLLPAGGGQNNTDFVADGTITSGAPVILTAAGKAKAITGSAQSIGTEAAFMSGATYGVVIVYDDNANKVVVAYRDTPSSNHGYAAVGTVSGTSISWGTPVVFYSGDISADLWATYDSTENKVVIAFQANTGGSQGRGIVGDVSGTSISFPYGSVIFSTNSASQFGCAYDAASAKTVISYRDNSTDGRAVVATVSGTAISFGTPVQYETGNAIYNKVTYDSNAQKVVIAYRDAGDSDKGKAVVGTVSGTSISFGSIATFNSGGTEYMGSAFDSTNNKTVIVYRDDGDSQKGKGIVGTISGTSISFGTPGVYTTSVSPYNSATFDSDTNQIIVAFNNATASGKFSRGTVSGTSISFSEEFTFANATTDYQNVTYDTGSNRAVFAYQDGANSNIGTGIVVQVGSTNLTSTNLLGIASGAISDTATGTINTWGSRNEVQTGLTIGSDYYVQNDGRIEAGVTNIAYDISSATYTQNFSVSSQSTDPVGLLFSPDGTSMYVVSGVYPPGAKNIFQYALTTAFDISTASLSKDFDSSGEDSQARGIQFNLDGTKMFINGVTGDAYYQYSLSSAYDISTASYDSVSFSLSSQDGNMEDVVFNADGTKFYGVGLNNYAIYQYSCSSAFDLSTASWDSIGISISSQDNSPRDLFFKPDGSKMWLLGRQNNSIYQYSLSSAFDLSTLSYDSISFSVNSEETSPGGLAFSANGEKFYVCGGTGDDVNQYATTANSFSTDHLIGKAITATQINIKDYTG